MVDIIAIAVIILIIGGSTAYIIRAKKRGQRCIGCPDSKTCGKGADNTPCAGGCGCGSCSSSNSCHSKSE